VATRSGVQERVFFEDFGDERACLRAVFEKGLERLSRTVGEAAGREGCWLDRLRAGLVAFLGFLDDEPAWGRLLILDRSVTDAMVGLGSQLRVLSVLTSLLDNGAPQPTRELIEPMLTSEFVVGGAISVIRSQMLKDDGAVLVELAPALMSFIVRPFLGQAAAQAELSGARACDQSTPRITLPVRTTHRTVAVLRAIAQAPRSSNRQIADIAGLADEGQTSKLLARLCERGVIENLGRGQSFGEPNAWLLTSYGQRVLRRVDSTPDGEPRVYKARRFGSHR
jgi:AcrR family transcriptional regulator